MPTEVVLRTLKHAWLTLASLEVPMALMGGMALALWQYVRTTRDVDLLVGLGQRDVNELLQKLSEAKIRPKQQPPIKMLGQLQIIQLLYEPAGVYVDLQIDLLLANSPYHLEALARRMPSRLTNLDLEIAVLTCEDLILHKLLAGRILDRVDVAALLRAHRTTLDLNYLSRWLKELGLRAEATEVWGEAFPGEQLPLSE